MTETLKLPGRGYITKSKAGHYTAKAVDATGKMGQKHSYKAPSNDWCQPLGDHQYADVMFNPFIGEHGGWTAKLRGKHLGWHATKRLAKKAIKKEW